MGVWIAPQLVWPQMNLDLLLTTFARLRPLHTNLVRRPCEQRPSQACAFPVCPVSVSKQCEPLRF
ncbi:hypothetical protein EMIT0196MI5_100034 [Pseudomonas sp. IT-196MI5]